MDVSESFVAEAAQRKIINRTLYATAPSSTSAATTERFSLTSTL